VMWFLLAVALLSVVVSFGPDAKLFTAAYRLMPGFGAFRVPARWLLVLVFAGALLAAYGTDALSASRRTSRRTLVTQGARWGVGLGLLAIAGLAGAAVSRPLGEGVGLAWALAGLGALALLAPLLVLPGPRLRWVAPLAVAVELVVASALTPARAPVPASAYAATGDVLATVRRLAGDGRVLGLADPAFEVSDRQRAALAATYRDTLGDASFREMLVTLKQREILAPNLGLAYGLPLADGYDGGVLPLRTYSELRDALLPGAGAQPDVLIANLVETIPADRVLNALGVQVVLRNNRQVISVGPATLDLEFHVPVGDPLEWHGLNLAGVTGVAILATSAGSAQAGPAGAIALDDGWGGVREVRLERRPGRPERVVVGDGHLVSARLGLDQAAFFSTARWAAPMPVRRVRLTASAEPFDLRAISLLHADGHSTALGLRRGGALAAQFVGDIAVLSRARGSPRVWLPESVHIAAEPAAAKAGLSDPTIDPTRVAWLVAAPEQPQAEGLQGALRAARRWLEDQGILPRSRPTGLLAPGEVAALESSYAVAGSPALQFPGAGQAAIDVDQPERVVVRVRTDGPQVVVLGDVLYPGWTATVDGVRAPVWQANLAQRAVLVTAAGDHEIVFQYRSQPFETGRVVSLATLAIGLGVVIAQRAGWSPVGALRHRRRIR